MMTSLKDLVENSKCNELQAVVETGTGKFVCFTRLDVEKDVLSLCASDGYDVWRLELDAEELETHRDLANMNTESFLSRLRSSFKQREISLSQVGVKVTVTFGRGSKTLTFDLYEAKALDKKIELHCLLFRLAENVTDMKGEIEKANQQIETLKQQRPSAGAALFDMDAQKKKVPGKAQVKQVGMSAINPGSKKRKAARGVQFN